MDLFWQKLVSGGLAQGDMLPTCAVPVIRPDFDQASRSSADLPIDVDEFDLIVMTQSCDLDNGKAPLVACCPFTRSRSSNRLTKATRRSGNGRRSARDESKGFTFSRRPRLLKTSGMRMSLTSEAYTAFRSDTSLPTRLHSNTVGVSAHHTSNTSPRRSPGSLCGSDYRRPFRPTTPNQSGRPSFRLFGNSRKT